jgi:hypothetical protein
MKRSILATLAMAVAISGCALAQDQGRDRDKDKQDRSAAAQSDRAAAFSVKSLTVSGKVSTDGKTFLTDIDSEWQVSNADALKGHEGRLVRVKCYVDTEKNSMKILSVKRDDNESNYAARNTDSAFRR